jgi:hypothetical protein
LPAKVPARRKRMPELIALRYCGDSIALKFWGCAEKCYLFVLSIWVVMTLFIRIRVAMR